METDQERDPKTFIIICFRSRSGLDLNSQVETDQERDPKTFIIICFRSRSGLDSKFKSSILMWKPIKSAIQRLL